MKHFALIIWSFPQLDYCQLHCFWQKEQETKLAVDRDKPSTVLHLLPPAAAASDSRANIPLAMLRIPSAFVQVPDSCRLSPSPSPVLLQPRNLFSCVHMIIFTELLCENSCPEWENIFRTRPAVFLGKVRSLEKKFIYVQVLSHCFSSLWVTKCSFLLVRILHI